MLRIAIAQINSTVGALEGNRQKILQYVRRAKDNDSDIVVFPELSITGYPPEDLLYKEHFVQDNIKLLRFLIKETKGIVTVVGFVDIDKNKNLYNAAAITYDGKLKGVYHKENLPNYGVFDEKRYFKSGTNDSQIFSHKGYLFGINICEDIWIDHAICDKQSKAGAQLLINISASPFDVTKFEKREKLLKTRAKQNKTFICYANLVGGQDDLVFDGGGLVLNPQGNIIASGKQFEEDLIVVDLDLKFSKKKTKNRVFLGRSFLASEKNAIKSHLSKNLNNVEKIYRALVLGTRDYIKKNGFEKVLIGLSGGVDSSLVAAIAVDAVGKENVVGVSMPSRYSSDGTKQDSKILANNLGIKFLEVSIENIFEAYLKTVESLFAGLKPNIAEENIQARIRGNLLMALSNKFGWLVLTTGNKSEMAVGYCTLYGDMSGGFAVIKDVPKTTVYELVKFKNHEQKGLIPESIIARAPTAELRLNQKDQDSLPPYDVLDQILKAYVEKHESLGKIARKNDLNTVKNVIRMIDRSEYKRRQAPPGIKITERAFGKDWRLPITNKYKEF